MTIPAPPSGESFSTQTHPNSLVAIKVLRVDPNWPDTFNRNEGKPVSATMLDVWVLADAPDVGSFVSNVPNTSMLGRQLAGSVGQTFYGRITAQRTGNGTSYILAEPYPTDAPTIAAHKAKLAAEAGQPTPSNYRAPTYQNEPGWQEPAPTHAPPSQPAVDPNQAAIDAAVKAALAAQAAAQPAPSYQPAQHGAPALPTEPPY